MDLEFHQLDLRYRDLRVSDPVREGRLLSSLAQSGQHVPALVVEGGDGRYVLIDGYRRVELLRRLGRDTVYAMVLSMDEPSALLFAYRLERSGRRSALEEGWLLKELGSVHGMGREALSRALLRSTSWISRRLGLVEVLPESVQHAVRAGCVPAHAAMKSLLPLARANKGAVRAAGGEPWRRAGQRPRDGDPVRGLAGGRYDRSGPYRLAAAVVPVVVRGGQAPRPAGPGLSGRRIAARPRGDRCDLPAGAGTASSAGTGQGRRPTVGAGKDLGGGPRGVCRPVRRDGGAPCWMNTGAWRS